MTSQFMLILLECEGMYVYIYIYMPVHRCTFIYIFMNTHIQVNKQMSKQVNKYPIPKYLNSKISAEVAKCHQGKGTWLKQCSGLLDLWS